MKTKNIIYILFTVSIMLMSSCVNLYAGQKVLVIQSYHPSLEWTVQCDLGIMDKLKDTYEVTFFYLDTKRLSPIEIERKTKEAYSFYRKYSPDLVMLGDDYSLQHLGPYITRLGTSVVYFGINNNPRSYFRRMPQNITGILERTPVFPAARILKKLLPATTKILFLFDASPTSESVLNVTFKKNESVKMGDVQMEYKVARDWKDWMNIILENNSDLIILVTFHAVKKDDGSHVEVKDVINWSSANSAVPIFSCQDYTVSANGTVGAYTLSGYNHGLAAANVAKKILEGKTAGSIAPVTDSSGDLYLNKVQMERFNLIVPDELDDIVIFK